MWVRASHLPLVAAILGLAAAAFADGTPAAPAPQPTPTPAAPAPLPRGAIAVYDTACANCHGASGSFYGPTLGQGKTDAQLRQVVKDMADGPGQITLQPVEVDALTAYHRAIIRHEPFLDLTARTPEKLEGEVTPGSSISIRLGKKTLAAKVDGSRWSAALPIAGGTPVITARLNDTQTVLDIARTAFSHEAPLKTGETTNPSTTGKPKE